MFPAGLHVVFDISKPVGRRVRSLDILCTRCRVPRYDPVEDEAVYTVIVPEYLVRGGDGYSVIGEEMLRQSSGEMFVRRMFVSPNSDDSFHTGFYFPPGDLDISVVSDYIKKRKQVYPAVEGRIKIYNCASGLWGQPAPLVLLVSLVLRWTL